MLTLLTPTCLSATDLLIVTSDVCNITSLNTNAKEVTLIVHRKPGSDRYQSRHILSTIRNIHTAHDKEKRKKRRYFMKFLSEMRGN